MPTKNHSTNQPPHGLGNLGQNFEGQIQEQCNLVHCETHRKGNYAPKNPKPWVVVENAGTFLEDLITDFATFREACNYVDRNYTDDDCPADIMRRRDDGTLTTEF